ncbi:MAG: RNA methyltransferase [Bacteroidales bacterium]|jgi:tRNA G18 (ribose-2'-O)-methylase SpoU|nr:RNA methyltransferase [Bacteroidales bacterium]
MHRKLKNNELGRLSQEEFKSAGKINVTVVLDNIRSQHNIGAAFRTSDSFLIEKILLCGCCATPPTAEIHKSALGAEFSVDWEYHKETIDAIAALKERGYTIVSIEQAENSIKLQDIEKFLNPDNSSPATAQENLSGRKYALVFGNEVKGVQQEVVDMSHAVIEIPQFGTKHSLNISVSLGIVLWEFCKALKINVQ